MSHDRRKSSASSYVPARVSTPSRGRPGGKSVRSVYGGLQPTRTDGAATSVQRKPRPGANQQKPPIQMLGYNLAWAGWQAAEAQSSWLDLTPERTRAPADRGVYDAASMSSAATMPVQRKTVVDDMDAPKADSIREERATIEPDRDNAAPAARGMGALAAGGLRRRDVATQPRGNDAGIVRDTDAPKADSVREERATIEPDDDSVAAAPLPPARAAHAVRRNRHTTAVYRVRPADVDTSAAPDTPAFAQAVARFQAAHGLVVDGIVGPKTVHALHRVRRQAHVQSAPRGGGAASTMPANAGHKPPMDVLEDGVLGPDDVLEDGVLGTNDVLEHGLIGQNDPLFAQGRNRQQPARRSDQLESGLIAEAVQRKAAGGHAQEAGTSQAAAGATAPHQPHAALLQMKENGAGTPEADVPAIAAAGVAGSSQRLPHSDRIQAAFGAHDVSGVRAHVGGAASEAARGIGAVAYATGNDVAFDGTPDLHTAAHEAAHVVQQQHGVQLKGGVGQTGDAHEQHADAVADAVVRGESAEALLDSYASGPTGTRSEAPVQKKSTYHRRDNAKLVGLLLRRAAAEAAAGVQQLHAAEGLPARLIAFRAAAPTVATTLRQAVRDASVPGGMSASLRSLLPMVDLAYTHAAELSDQAGASHLYDAARDQLHDSMQGMAELFSMVGWQRPKNARDNHRRERRADASAPPRALSAADRSELVHLTLHTATHRARALEASGGAANVATEARGLRRTAQFIAQDVSFATETMRAAFTTPGQRRQFVADIDELASQLDGLAEWANAARAGTTGFADLFAKETELRRLVGKAPKTRAIEGPHIDGQAGQVVTSLVSPNTADLGAYKTKTAALSAIHDQLGLVFEAAAGGINAAEGVVEEPPPPKKTSDWHVLLDIAIDAALVFPGASVATAIAALPALAARKVIAGGVKASIQQVYKSSIAAARAGTQASSGAAQKDPANAGAAGSIAGRTPKTQYFSIQEATVLKAKTLALAKFANLRDQLANLDLDTLNDVSAQLTQLAVGPTIKHAQEEASLTEWVNFKARWIHGAPEGSKRDADLTGVSHREGEVASVLNVYASIDPQVGPDAKVSIAGLCLPGVEPSVVEFFKETGSSIGALPFNRVVRVNHGGSGGWDQIALTWHPDGDRVTLNDVTPEGEALLIAYAVGKVCERGFEFIMNDDMNQLLRIYGRGRIHEGARKLVRTIAGMSPKALRAD